MTSQLDTKVKAVAFDLDGTLINSAKGLSEAIDLMLERLGYPIAGFAKVSTWIGNGAVNLVETALKDAGDMTLSQFEEGFALFNEFYAEISKSGNELYPGVMETLVYLKLKGYQLALITNKPSRFLPALLKDLQIAQFFNLILGADDVSARKPHPAPIFQTLGAFGLYPQEILFVGDSRNDIQSAKNAGVASVAVTYGYNFGSSISEENPTFIIDQMPELIELL